MDKVRVFIVDDHELVRYALRTLLEGEPDIEVIGEASDGEGAVTAVCAGPPDVLLLDLRMPGLAGVEVCRRIKEKCADVRVLVLTSFDEDDEVFGVLAAGASGYIMKDTRPEVVVQAVRSVADGQAVFDQTVAARVIAGPSEADAVPTEGLSERELEVLALMAEGKSNKEIARTLWISDTTVKTHVSHILRKLGQADRTQAVLKAVRTGIVALDSES